METLNIVFNVATVYNAYRLLILLHYIIGVNSYNGSVYYLTRSPNIQNLSEKNYMATNA